MLSLGDWNFKRIFLRMYFWLSTMVFKPTSIFFNDWAALWVLICMVHLIICYCRVVYAFQSESIILHSCLNDKEPIARIRRDIWNLSASNGIWTHNDLVRKRTLNHLAKLVSLAKWLSFRLQSKWLWVRVSHIFAVVALSHLALIQLNSFSRSSNL